MATYFDVLASIINKKPISDEDIEQHFVPFQAVKWVSSNPMACYEANKINCFSKVPKEAEYRFLKHSIKLPKNTRIAFDKKDKYSKIILETLAKEYKIPREAAKEYIKILGKERVLEILNKWAHYGNSNIKDKDVLDLREAIKLTDLEGME